MSEKIVETMGWKDGKKYRIKRRLVFDNEGNRIKKEDISREEIPEYTNEQLTEIVLKLQEEIKELKEKVK